MFAVVTVILTFACVLSDAFGVLGVGVHTGPGVRLGAYAVVSTREADLRFPTFIFALAFVWVVCLVQAREMVCQCLLYILCVGFATH